MPFPPRSAKHRHWRRYSITSSARASSVGGIYALLIRSLFT
jgi:hypothetical protein